jgi:hypothetical protein
MSKRRHVVELWFRNHAIPELARKPFLIFLGAFCACEKLERQSPTECGAKSITVVKSFLRNDMRITLDVISQQICSVLFCPAATALSCRWSAFRIKHRAQLQERLISYRVPNYCPLSRMTQAPNLQIIPPSAELMAQT